MKTIGILFNPFNLRILIIFLLVSLTSCSKQSVKEFTIIKGKFVQSITESGELQAIDAAHITMPAVNEQYGYAFKIIGLVEHGAIVKKGDSIAALDPSSIYKYIIQKEESLENVKARADIQKVQMENAIKDLEVSLKNEQATYELKQLELERMQFESDRKKRIKELEFMQAKVRLEKMKRNLELKPILGNYDVKISNLSISQHENDIKSALETLKYMIIYSSGNGYFQIGSNRWGERKQYKLGDELYSGVVIASIPDISTMKVFSYVNENDINKIKKGMRVIIRLDALPSVSFNAVVNKVSHICTTRDEEKIFTTEIIIQDNDIRLKPGMSVSCEYVCYESEDEIYVPNKCLLNEGSHSFILVKKGASYEKTEVETGASNANYTVIKTRLKPGRELMPVEETSDI